MVNRSDHQAFARARRFGDARRRHRKGPLLFRTLIVALGCAGALFAPVARAVDPTFRGGAPASMVQNPIAVVAINIDGDGQRDLVVLVDTPGQSNAGKVIVMRADGRGGFAPGTLAIQQVALGLPAVRMVAGEFTGDTRVDLVVSVVAQTGTAAAPVSRGQVRLLKGDAAGGFGPPSVMATMQTAQAPLIRVADVTADGLADVVAVEQTTGTVHLLTGVRGGGVMARPIQANLTGPVTDITTGDINADSRADLLVNSGKFTSVYLARSVAPVGFQAAGAQAPDPSSDAITSITLIDIDQDGALDLVMATRRTAQAVVGSQTGDVWVFTGLRNGVFNPVPRRINVGPSPTLMRSQADLNGDGYVDLTASLANLGGVVVAPTNDAGRHTTPLNLPASPNTGVVVPADLNSDERLDLVLLDQSAKVVTGLFNATTFPPPLATTGGPSDATKSSVKLTGVVTSRLIRTTYRFEYGPTTAYGSVTPDAVVEGGRFAATVNAVLPGQFAGDTIHYRLVATNRFGTTAGADGVAATIGLVERVRFLPRWRAGRQLGSLDLRGLPRRSGKLNVVVRFAPTSKVVLRRRVALSAKRGRITLPLPPALAPGEYHVRLVGPDETGATITHLSRIPLRPPKVGYAQSFFSRFVGSRAIAKVKYGPRNIYANYRFDTEPAPTPARVLQTCSGPVAIAPLIRRYQRNLVIAVSTGSPLPRGRYTCTLHVGRRRVPVAQATIRIR